ncbi:MAG: hypothetical protein QG553_245 [Patescibacteria group bacterium]|nr:hypothetical protein [Patescibacteria group bacterium]
MIDPNYEQLSLDTMPRELDNYDQVYRLERISRALNHIEALYSPPDVEAGELQIQTLRGQRHSAERIGNQFGARVVRAFLLDDPEAAYDRLKGLRPTTPGQEMVTLINQDEFAAAHDTLHTILRLEDPDVASTVADRLAIGGAFARADHHQFHGPATATIDTIRTDGVTLKLPAKSVGDVVKQARIANDGPLPIIEFLKNHKTAHISGFDSSKISLMVHDTVDHMWTFDLIDRLGYLDKFAELFRSVGNPQDRNIFHRESEMVASIAFGVRYFKEMEPGLIPVISSERLLKLFEARQQAGQVEERHQAALAILRDMHYNQYGQLKPTLEARSLSFVFSNYVCELNEQRRKHGKIKQIDEEGVVVAELSPFNLDYLAFFVETHHELLDSKNKHRDFLAKSHILIEEFFVRLLGEKIQSPYQLNLTLDKVHAYDPATSILPRQRIHWMLSNYGFTANQKITI